MKYSKGARWLAVVLAMGICGLASAHQAGEGEGPAGKYTLTRELAQQRAGAINGVDYVMQFEVDGQQPDFKAKALINVDLKTTTSPLVLDLNQAKVESVLVNGKAIKDFTYDGQRLSIPGTILTTGRQGIEVNYRRAYSDDGNGLHRFKDPEDGKVYMYTHFEPFSANKVFALFDQPDLKASFQLNVTAPKDWIVISAMQEANHKVVGQKQTWQFPATAKISPYVMSLHAGPFKSWEDKSGSVPMRLFARQSLAKFVDAPYWFDVTKRGFDYYQAYFGVPYPFVKYDQVIVPEFNAGAMENVAAVTFSERFVHRGHITDAQKRGLANTILHEQAHMWFGDYVTMQWWDDLWLNESFASLMAHKAMADGLKTPLMWRDFFNGLKTWAYWEDQLVTTHPITTTVTDTDSALANFDGITYGKGASVLRQLEYQLTPDVFQQGVQTYMKTYGFKNAVLADFMGTLGKVAHKDLGTFSQAWMATAGLNRMSVKWECDGDELDSLEVLQYPDERFGGLKEHKTQIGFVYETAPGKLEVKKTIDVQYKSASTPVEDLKKIACPKMIYPNHGDFDYVKVNLDSKSEIFARDHIQELQDVTLRAMVWHSYWTLVEDARLPAPVFATMVHKALSTETDPRILSSLLERLSSLNYFFVKADPTAAEKFVTKVTATIQERLVATRDDLDLRQAMWGTWIDLAHSDADQKLMMDWLAGRNVPEGMKVDQDRRWDIVARLSVLGNKAAVKLRTAEEKRDPSYQGKRSSLATKASWPDPKVKASMWQEIFNLKSKLNPGMKSTIARNLFPLEQIAMRQPYEAKFFTEFPKLVADSKDNLGLKLVGSLVPTDCTRESAARIGSFIDSQDLPYSIVRQLKIAKQEDERCERIRALIKNSLTLDTTDTSKAKEAL